MKNYYFIISFLFTFIFFSCSKDENLEVLPKYHYFNGKIGVNDKSTVFSNDGNVIICGRYNDNLFILKTSNAGKVIWRKEYYKSGNTIPSIIEVESGELYMCDANSLLFKLNSQGDTLWTKQINANSNFIVTDLIETADGNIILSKYDKNYGYDSELYKVDSNGNILWMKQVLHKVITRIVELNNGEIITSGYNGNGLSGKTLILSKYDSTGSEIWSNSSYDIPLSTNINSLIRLPSGELMMSGNCQYGGTYDSEGHRNPVSSSPENFYLFKFDNSGNLVFSKTYGLGSAYSMKKNNDDTFTIIGNIETEVGILKIDKDGNKLLWKKTGDVTSGMFSNIVKDNENNIITGNYNGSVCMIITDNNGVFK